MPDGPEPSRPDAPKDHSAIRKHIGRSRRLDATFAVLGLALVIAAVSVLGILFGQLVRDGRQRLMSGHEVKASGFSPGMRDLVGELVGRDGDYRLKRDTYVIPNAAAVAKDVAALRGKPVIVAGDLPPAGLASMDATGITAAESPEVAKYSRSEVHGVLRKKGDAWHVEPTPLPLDLSALGGRGPEMVGKRVVVETGMSRTLPLKVREVEPLVYQGFLNSMPSREASRAGVKSALVGSILVVGVTMILSIPLGVAAGIYLEEYGRKNWFTSLIEINIANLAGVPSIVWGLMALGLFVYGMGFGRSILTAALTLGLLVLPIVITATRESIRAIPLSIREASYACGASKWQTVRYHVLPYSFGGILTGGIIGLSRAIGETAPLITIGAMTYIAFLPDFSWSSPFAWLKSEFTVLPIQMFNWVSRPDKAFQQNAAAAGLLLLALTLSMNAIAIILRYRLRKSIKW